MARSRALPRALVISSFLLLPAFLLIASPAAACHGNDHKYFIRGKVTFDDGSTQAGLIVRGSEPTPSGGPEPTCPFEGRTDVSGRYEVIMHMHPPSDNGDTVTVKVLDVGTELASLSHVADLQPSQPTDYERFKENVDFVIPAAKKPRVELMGYVPIILAALAIVAVAGVVVWDVRRVRARRIADQVEKKRGEKLSPEERRERAAARKTVECDTCGAKVRADRMNQHFSKVHPRKL